MNQSVTKPLIYSQHKESWLSVDNNDDNPSSTSRRNPFEEIVTELKNTDKDKDKDNQEKIINFKGLNRNKYQK